jgi:stage II sporulation protein AA (anti-sigma F factor antagonist)
MDVEVKAVADAQVVTVMKRFDAYTAGAVESALNKLIAGGARKVIIDFSTNEYLASAGLRVLISATKNLQRSGGKLVLCSIKPNVLEVFDISGLKRIFKMYDSVDAALADLK